MFGVIKNTESNELTQDGGEGTLGVCQWDVAISEFLHGDVSVNTGTQTVYPLEIWVVYSLILKDSTRACGSKLDNHDLYLLVFIRKSSIFVHIFDEFVGANVLSHLFWNLGNESLSLGRSFWWNAE